MATTTEKRDYSLIGPSARQAAEQGLVAADWYHPDVPRKRMKELMRRSDGPALRDTALWLALLVASGVGGGLFWGTWLTVPFFLVYGVRYGSASDSRWHEAGHGTAFVSRDPDAAMAFETNARGRWQCDLYALARQRLEAMGQTDIAGGGWCTYSDPKRFYSFRREGRTGRMAALIWMLR